METIPGNDGEQTLEPEALASSEVLAELSQRNDFLDARLRDIVFSPNIAEEWPEQDRENERLLNDVRIASATELQWDDIDDEAIRGLMRSIQWRRSLLAQKYCEAMQIYAGECEGNLTPLPELMEKARKARLEASEVGRRFGIEETPTVMRRLHDKGRLTDVA